MGSPAGRGAGASAGVGEAAHPRLTYRPELDGIRALAVLLVIANHAGLLPDAAGTTGVTIFFVLSGYLITSLLIAERADTGSVKLRSFYGRRARRLLPALGALLVVMAAWMASRGELGTYLPQAAAAALYWADFAPLAHVPLGQLSHTWSLSLEEQFYALWPLAFLVLAWPRRWLAVAIVGAVAFQLLLPDGPFRFVTRADAIIAGCLLAFAPLRFRLWPLAWLAIVAVVSRDVPPVAMTIASVGLLTSTRAAPVLANRLLVRIGQISYGLYLWHFPILAMLSPWPVAILATFAVALASERWVERPFRHRRASQGAGPLVAAASA